MLSDFELENVRELEVLGFLTDVFFLLFALLDTDVRVLVTFSRLLRFAATLDRCVLLVEAKLVLVLVALAALPFERAGAAVSDVRLVLVLVEALPF